MHARWLAIVLLFAAGIGMPREALAVTCTATMSSLVFGNVNPLSSQTDATADLDYTCNNTANSTRHVRVCFSIGDGVQGGAQANPRRMLDGSGNPLWFQLYQNGSYTTVWGSSFFGVNTPVEVGRSIGRRGSISGTVRLFGRVNAGQLSAVPGVYQDQFIGNHTAITINESNSSVPGSCSLDIEGSFQFTASATVVRQCAVNASGMNFGNAGPLLGNTDSTSTVAVQCANGTAYQVGLDNGQHATGNARRMSGPGGMVGYELYRNSARNLRWGATPGNTVLGSGTGGTQNFTVYGRVPSQTTPPAGVYTDTIVVTVTY